MKKSYSILCLASLLLASCSQEQDNQLSSQEKPVYLQVDVEPLSRATLLNDLPSECEYGIYCYEKASKVDYVKGKSTILDPIALSDYDDWVFAYYPWSERNDLNLKKSFVRFSIFDDIDYLWGRSRKQVSMYTPQASIQFHHVFSYIDFVIQPNEYLEESLKKELKVYYITIGDLPTECSILANEYEYIQLESFTEICLKSDGQSLADGPVKLGTLCGPSKDSSNTWSDYVYQPVTIRIFFENQDAPAEIEIPRNNWTMEAGKKYTRYITINGRLEAELSETVSVAPWKDGESQDFIVK